MKNDGAGAGEPGLFDFPWQHYVAMHAQAKELVGPGITAFVPAFIAGTRDPNRSGDPRLDFIIRHTDGGYWRIHPGSKPRYDVRPKYFEPSGETMEDPGDQWRVLQPDRGFSYRNAIVVPQTDRIGKRQAWAVLENLPLGRLDSSADATFKWWLWLANLGAHTRVVLGNGVVALDLTENNANEKHLLCTRADGSTIKLVVTPRGVTPITGLALVL